jgi:preprotein translocase subunit YajC
MKLALISIASVALAFAAPAAPALAQAAGTQVVDTTGGAVGTVVRLDGANVVIKTDKHEVALPKTSFTAHEGKLLFGMTQAQLNAEVEKSLAEAAAAVAPGATVKGSGGTVVGTVEAVEADLVTIKLQSGNLVRIPRSGVAGSNGEVVIGMTAQELEAQVAPATGGGQ